MSTDPRDPLPGTPGMPEHGPDPWAGQAGSTTQSRQVPEPLHETATTRTYDAPRRARNTGRLAVFGIAGLVALAGVITGIAATSNHTPPPAAVPVHPAAAPAGRLLATLTGGGLRYSAPFLVSHSPLIAQYSYRCTSGSHPFTAAIAASRSNISTFASTTGTGTSRTATIYPHRMGAHYRIAAASACPYRVSVYQP
jgi:hypothetical protein